ncbi:MAG: stage III sporulation protein AF [Bacillus sp. (in: Bacteria)]|nr:stage III sporulation protein AF [Bacillus sp. (in: firmicutes)]MCM1425107.1 stage III sporulation protein AF [Eubacterium sp.]
MDTLVELIKKIGIFMIAAQAVVHFAPGLKYEKYIRMIVGVMILLQFLAPVYRMMERTVSEKEGWYEQLFSMEGEIIADKQAEDILKRIEGSNITANSVIEQIEKEIKSKLNNGIEAENYRVINVRLTMRDNKNQSGDEREQYKLESVRVAVRRTYRTDEKESQNNVNQPDTIEKVQIQKIDIALDRQNEQVQADEMTDPDEKAALDEREKEERELKQRFCRILGMDEKYMEVSVYGLADEDNG